MAADPRLTNLTASSACNAVVDRLDEGAGAATIIFYNGTIPTDADTAVGAQTALSTCTFSDPAFGNASNGTATASSITGSTAGVSGTATWARWLTSGSTAILDCTVGTSGEDINFNSNVFVAGASISITSLTVAQPKT